MRISKVIGIDLGTTNSLATVMDLTDSNIIMHYDKFGRKLTPSIVAYDFGKDQILVGQPAFRRRGTEPEPIVSVKREMANPNKKLVLGPFEKTPVEISALILQETVRKIREELDKQSADSRFIVDRAIITVPGYFNADQKEATCEAGKKAGLEVMEILYEPTAAAIHYSWKHNITDATFMVYDFGGGTFDVSIIRQLHGEPQVLGIAGDNFLGGDDFDRLLAQYIYDILEKEEGYVLDFDLKNCKEDQIKFTKLIMFAEGIKKELSTKDVHFAEKQDLFEDKNGQNVIVEMDITRATFNQLIEEKVNSTIPCCEEALKKAKEKSDITLDQIDYIIMVGGSTKIPLVQQKVKEAFCSGKGGKPKAKCAEPIIDEPDLAVAMGAAIQAANYGLNMYDDNERVIINLRNPGGTSRSTYNLFGEVTLLDNSLNIEGGIIRINIREGGFSEEKKLEDNGKFSFKKIPLQVDTFNNLEISVFDKDKQELATFGRTVVQDKEHKAIGGGLISPNQLAKPFCLEIIKGNKLHKEVLFPEGTSLPVDGNFIFYTTDQSGIIRMPFYEENRVLKVIETDVDASLPVGTPVKFFLNCCEKHYITGHYKIKDDQFAIRIEPPPQTPPPTKKQYENLLFQFAEAISYLPAGQKMIIQGKKKKICKDIEEAFQFNDEPKLRQRVAELEGLIKEIEVQDQPLEPPKAQFDLLIQKCHQLGLYANEILEDFDLYEWEANIDTQRKFGEDAYQAKDQERYSECYKNLASHYQHLQDKLQDRVRGPMAEPTDEERAVGLVAALQQGIEELEFLARAQNKVNLLKNIERQAKELKQLELLCTSAPQRVIRDGQRIHTELQKIARQLIEDPKRLRKFEGLLTK